MKKANVKINFIYQVTYQILVLALPFLISPYVSRKLGAEGLGTYSYSYSVAYYFVLISMLGILNYGNRAIAKVRDNRDKLNQTFSEVLTLHICISLIGIILYIIYVAAVASSKLYASIQIVYVFSGLFDITWFYYGLEKFKSTVTRNIIVKILTFAGVFTFIHNKNDLWKYCLIMAISFLVSQIILWGPLKKYVTFVRVNRHDVLKHLKPMLVLFIPTIAISLYKYMDKIMIGMMSNKVQLGFYENSEMLNKAVLSVITSVGTVLLPQMSNLVEKKDWVKYKKYLGISMRYVMLMAWAGAFGLAAVADVFAPLYWGDEFSEVGTIIQILSITIPFISFANVLRTQYLLPFERDKDYALSVIIGAVINVIANSLLIPRYGANGASAATVLAEATVCIVQTIQVRKEINIKEYLIDGAPFGIIGLIMFLIVYNMPKVISKGGLVCLLLQILAGVLVYAIGSIIVLRLKKDETLNSFVIKCKKLKRKDG